MRPRRGRQWSRRGSAARGGWPAPNRRCPRAALPWSRSPNPPWPIPPPTGGQIPRRRRRCSVRRYRPTVPSRSSYLPPRGPPVGCTRRWQRREHVARSSSNAHATPGRCSIAPIASTASAARSDFSALLAGVPVTAFAAAEYTGWGVTDDNALPLRGFRRSVDEIFAGICLVATRCRDPFRDAATGFEEALAILAEWRRIETMNRRIAVCVGMSFWKRRRIADFVRSSAGAPVFRRTIAGALEAARAGRGKEKRRDRGLGIASAGRACRGGRSCRRNADPRRGRLHPLGRARLRFPAAGLAGVRCERDVFRSARRQRSRMPAARQRFFSRPSRPRRAAQRAARRTRHHQVQSGVRRPDRRHPGGSSMHLGAGAGRGRSVDPFRGRRGAHQSRPAGEGARREPRCVYRVQAAPRRCRRTPDRRGAGQRGTALSPISSSRMARPIGCWPSAAKCTR